MDLHVLMICKEGQEYDIDSNVRNKVHGSTISHCTNPQRHLKRRAQTHK